MCEELKSKRAEYDKEYRQKNKKRIRERNKKRYIEDKEILLERNKQWRKSNPNYTKEYSRKWRMKNPEYSKEYQRKWNQENREHINEMCRQRRIDNPEYEKKYSRSWRKTEKGKASNQRRHATRRAKEKEILSTLTSQGWLNILEEYNYRCAYCGIEFDIENMPERDHVIPISKGGHNTKENVVPACRSCNAKKSNKIILVGGGII